jgi:hypothetical protein
VLLGSELIAVVETPGGMPAVTHLTHPGVRTNLISHPCQITTGALLKAVATDFLEGTCSDAAFAALAKKHASLTLTQQARLRAMEEEVCGESDD